MDHTPLFLPRPEADRLLEALRCDGYGRVLAPVARDGTVVLAPIQNWEDLPAGLRDEQAPGHYRLVPGEDHRCFAWANGPQGLKPLTFAPREVMWQARRDEDGSLSFDPPSSPTPEATAVIGARPCDLAALALQERHFLHGRFPDPAFRARREALFLVAVACTHPADTCFCAATGDGPGLPRQGFDLGLTELEDGYLVRAGSDRGRHVLQALDLAPAGKARQRQARAAIARAAKTQTRTLPGRQLQADLYARLEADHWAAVGRRCLSCGNCTAVCPTCFCHMEMDEPTLDGRDSTHLRQWSSCFNAEHSFMGHFVVRHDTRLRYRQWLTHKLASWHEQYGRSGCVGCGRCITWCPVGIDLTAETAALLAEAPHGTAS
ncbi:MAG: 4Fe-4S dicluster domain-containing protein [Ectothiorhodospira sp.]